MAWKNIEGGLFFYYKKIVIKNYFLQHLQFTHFGGSDIFPLIYALVSFEPNSGGFIENTKNKLEAKISTTSSSLKII